MKFEIVTFGCKVNIYESEIMSEKLLEAGFLSDDKNPDIVIINTCSVTNTADSKCRKSIRRKKREKPEAILVVCGCSSENHREILRDFGIDILIGNNDKSKIVELINNFIESRETYVKFYDNKRLEFENMKVSKFSSKTRAFVKIQDGCDNYCAYCIIPFMRGNIRFKDLSLAIDEINELVSNGHKEIVLTGIHTGSYGRGLDFDLVDLLESVCKNENLNRIRISSIEITEITDKFLEMLKDNNKVCDHLHIPLQSGNDKILKLMNRKYNLDYYESVIKKIRSIRKDISITTDLIVGFPNETEEDFNITKEFCKKLEFAKIHIFPYSVRTGTKAAIMENHVLEKEKKRRAHELGKVSDEYESKYYEKFLGKNVEVLIEEKALNGVYGHTSNFIKVFIPEDLECNEIYNIKINKVNKSFVEGNSLKKSETIV